MAEQMRAAQKTGPERARIERFARPTPGPQDVLVRVRACAICASDLAGWREADVAPATPGVWNASNPGLTGHEIAGDIVEVGSDVRSSRLGEPVWIDAIAGCRRCEHCNAGRFTYCSQSQIVSQGFAEYVVAPAGQCLAIPHAIRDYSQASLLFDMVGTPVGAARRARIEAGESVAVWGLGPVGLGLVQSARIAKAGRVVGIDPIASRRVLAEQLGATDVLDPSATDAVAAVRELTGGRGADVVLCSVASDAGALAAFDSLRLDGRMVTVAGFPPAGGEVPKWVSGNWACFHGDWPNILGLVESGEFELGRYVTDVFALDDIEQAFAMRLHAPDRSLKVVVAPGGDAGASPGPAEAESKRREQTAGSG